MSLRWPSYFNAKVYYYIDDNPENIGTITMPLDDVKVFYEYSEELYFNNYEGSYYINLNYASYLESSYILENSDSLKIIQKIDYWINEDAVNKQLAIDGKETFAEQDIWSVGYLLFGMEENFSNPNYDDYKTGTIIFDSNYDSPDTDRLVINISDYSEYVETFVFSNYFFNKVSAEYEDIWNNNILLFSLDASINFIPFYTGYTEITTGSANIEDENGLFKDYKYFNPVISGEAAGAYTAISFENIIDDFKPFDGNAVVFKLQIEDKSLKDTKILFSIVDNCPDINNYNYSEYSLNEFKPVDNDNVYLICNDAWIDTFDMQDPGLFINIQGLGDLQDVNTLTIEYMIFPSKDNITILPLNHEPIYLEGKLEYENRYEFPRYYGVEGDLYWGYSDGSYTLKDAPIKVELNSGKLYSFKFRNDNKLKEETKSFYWDIVDEDTGNSILSNNLNNREQITIGSPVVEGLNVSSVKKPYFEIYFGCEKNPTFLYLIKDFEYTIDYSD